LHTRNLLFVIPVLMALFLVVPSVKAQSNTPTCPSGYTLSQDQSQCVSDTSNTPTCPSGYSLSSDGSTCTSDQSSTPTCPSGYTLSSDQKTCESDTGNAIKGAINNGIRAAGPLIVQRGICLASAALIGIPC
jgi:hypothetical protein